MCSICSDGYTLVHAPRRFEAVACDSVIDVLQNTLRQHAADARQAMIDYEATVASDPDDDKRLDQIALVLNHQTSLLFRALANYRTVRTIKAAD